MRVRDMESDFFFLSRPSSVNIFSLFSPLFKKLHLLGHTRVFKKIILSFRVSDSSLLSRLFYLGNFL